MSDYQHEVSQLTVRDVFESIDWRRTHPLVGLVTASALIIIVFVLRVFEERQP